MRIRLGHLIVLATCLATVGWRFPLWQQAVTREIQQIQSSTRRDHATSAQTYVLTTDRWLDFELPAKLAGLRVLTTANLLPPIVQPDVTQPRPGWRYAIEIQLESDGGQVLTESTYNFRTNVNQYSDPQTAELFTPTFYDDPNRIPCGTRTLLIPPNRLRNELSKIRLKIESKDQQIDDIGVRVFARKQRPDFHKPYVWQRTTKRQKEKLARCGIYPYPLLAASQQHNLLRWLRLPLAPTGLEGRDYQRRALYVLNDVQGYELADRELPAGLLLSDHLAATIPLPGQPGTVRLVGEPLGESNENSRRAIEITRYGRSAYQQQKQRVHLTHAGQSIDFDSSDRLLKLRSDGPLCINAFWRSLNDRSEFHEITPRPSFVQCYWTTRENQLSFKISHVDGKATPFRFTARQMMAGVQLKGLPPDTRNVCVPPLFDNAAVQLQWEFVSSTNVTLDHGNIDCTFVPSEYDFVTDEQQLSHVSDPQHFYFRVPNSVARIRIGPVEGQILLSAATRPPDIPKITRVPDDYIAFDRPPASDLSWFLVRPEQYSMRLDRQQTVTVRTRIRPPQTDADIVMGNYEWQDFKPVGPWKGRYLLTPTEPDAPFRTAAAAMQFCEIPVGQEVPVEFFRYPAETRFAPRLVVLAQPPFPMRVSVLIDDRLHDDFQTLASPAERSLTVLDAMNRRTHQIHVQCQRPARILVNRVQLKDAHRFLKRFALRFDELELEFPYEKLSDGREVLTMRYFRDPRATNPIRLDCQIVVTQQKEPIHATSAWTILRRAFVVQINRDGQSIVLGTTNQTMDAGQPCYIPLEQDLSPGRYKIQLRRFVREPAYVILSRAVPGVYHQEDLKIQPSANPVKHP